MNNGEEKKLKKRFVRVGVESIRVDQSEVFHNASVEQSQEVMKA